MKKKFYIKGRKALLLAEGCKLSKQAKDIKERLEEIKDDLNFDKIGEYYNDAQDTLVITKADNWSEIHPSKVREYLKKNKMLGHLPKILKVQITMLKKYVPESVYNKWRKKLDPTYRWSWK